MERERVVVTGIGLVTPCGVGTDATWQAVVRGESGAAPITLFETNEQFPTRFACEVKDFDATRFMEKKKLKEVCRFIPFSLAATQLALEQANLQLSDEEREEVGTYIGVGLGGLENLEKVSLIVHDASKGPGRVSPYFIPSLIANMAAGQVAIQNGFHGPSLATTTACSSSADAIGSAARLIQRGEAQVMVAGGAEATISAIGIAGFSAMFALSRRNDDPKAASRPFDKGRDGFVCGEGAGTLVLESLTRAKKRGATILAEITGYGATTDAFHITKPPPDHVWAQRAMKKALADARLDPAQVDYINAHGTSTPSGDIEEARAIAAVFGPHALDKRLWVSSTKSMTGHLLGAAGAVEAGLCIEALRTGRVPPTINLDDQDEACPLEFVANAARERRLTHVLSNSFGFGGHNATLVMSRFSG